MNKLTTTILLFLFPALVLADGSSSTLNFAPPPSDYSMVFLGNLFGIVDGVLSGTGSQIMGNMFGVFNSAVLALGGIIIMYTLMVSTMNTAHEGQMLGQKWSSIWIPVRSTVGLALLIPKASGYCLMQIFVMWIVVQGVGAADKIWNAALSYLNRGGVIIQAQQVNPANALTGGNTGMAGIATGAMTILSGQVCMLGLQTQLQNQRQTYLNNKANGSGPCAGNNASATMKTFCNTAVPDFVGTVNAVTTQNNNPTASSWSVQMPNFDSTSPYSFLNGICGTLNWNSISTLQNITTTAIQTNGSPALQTLQQTFGVTPQASSVNVVNNVGANSSALAGASSTVGQNTNLGGVNLTPDELSTAQMSRAIAIQQMYVDLSSVAQTIIGNSPALSPNSNNNTTPYIPGVATQQFGVPYTQNSTICSIYNQNCFIWGPAAGSTGGGTLFNGTEFLNAINDYNGIMMPTLNVLTQMNNATNANNSRAFITNASLQGWIMAGSYFFNLVQIQGSATMNASMTDSNTGLDKSTFNATIMASAFGNATNGVYQCTGNYATLCTWFGGNLSQVLAVQALIDGTGITSPTSNSATTTVPQPSMAANPNRNAVGGQLASTVYGFTNNSVMVQLPGQPGLEPLTFANTINFSVNTSLYTLQQQNFSCGEVKILFFSFCLGQMMGNLFYNIIFLFIYNTLMQIFGQIINQVIMAFLMIPLQGMASIFKQGVAVLAAPGVNPIVALANMGVQYINFSGNLWLMLLDMAVTSALIPVFGIFIFALISLSLPLLLAWVGVMTSIGFTTAYYIPMLPYMIFSFGALGWLITVIEAMVAAPIVALGVTHPEGHDAFGKGEAAIMILLNVFLRPSMMIIGYIAAIALSYVGVWILNAGYDQAIAFIQQQNTTAATWGVQQLSAGSGGYSDWAGIYAFFFSILTYTTMYLVLVQKSFTLISHLPDKVLRWIGANQESIGGETAAWAGDVQKQHEGAAEKTQAAQGQMEKQLGGAAMKGISAGKDMLGDAGGSGSAEASGDKGGDEGGGGAGQGLNLAKNAGGA